MEYDVIVVGAGPAGCAAAYDLAAAGHSVLLLDRTQFPRMKPCAGALTVKAVRALRYPIGPVVRTTITGLTVSREMRESTTLTGRKPICLMTVRSEFDDYCLSRTTAAGARFQVVKWIEQVAESEDSVCLNTADGDLRARFLIAADGSNSRIRHLCGGASWVRRVLAIEARLPACAEAREMELDFGEVEHGYGWSFHKGDHLNVGVYTASTEVRIGRAELLRYVQRKFGDVPMSDVCGQYLGVGGHEYRPEHRRIFFVGDAAGFVDPLSGEGIHNAIRSGQATAQAILDELNGHAPAYEGVQKTLRGLIDDLAFCSRVNGKFYGHLKAGFAVIGIPGVKSALAKGYALGLTLSAIRENVLRLPLLSRDAAELAGN